MKKTDYTLKDFVYSLPEEQIALRPEENRDDSRLLVCDNNKLTHLKFNELCKFFKKGDCLVVNNSKVIPARLFGKRESGAKVELLLVRHFANNEWEAIGKPGKYLKKGHKIYFDNNITAEVLEDDLDVGKRIIKFDSTYEALLELGHVPLPPYINRADLPEDKTRYQTVYAKTDGSVAAPTAGLHFTEPLMNSIKNLGVNICNVTLHVSIGTFRPVKTENLDEHQMEKERFFLSKETAELINKTKKEGGRIITVGTTTLKTLESAARICWPLRECSGASDLFIRPPFDFKTADALITNFHQPGSTLMMLVSAFAGYDNVMDTYKTAVEKKYRFLSYGDSTLFTREKI